MSFLKDYLFYNEENEAHRNYHLWSALSILVSALGRRVLCKQGYFDIYPNLYICLVGKQGGRKSTAKDIARDLFTDACPDVPVGASVQSREAIVQFMASPECMRAMDVNGQPVEFRPLVLFINELKNWLSVNPGAMIDFLTDIYDRKYFDASTIKRGLERIENPCVNILACETPEWIIDKFKLKIISGGFSRRMIYVYVTNIEADLIEKKPFPSPTPAMKEARERCVQHLKRVTTLSGEMQWTDEAKDFYSKWYKGLKTPSDETMEGYYKSKHIQLLKVIMALAAAEYEPKLVITVPLLEYGIALLDMAEVNMPLLSIAAGRNELAVPQQRILELLKSHGGYIRKKILHTLLDKDLEPREQYNLLMHLSNTTGMIKICKVHRNTVPFEEVWLTESFANAIATKHLTLEGTNIIWKNGQ